MERLRESLSANTNAREKPRKARAKKARRAPAPPRGLSERRPRAGR